MRNYGIAFILGLLAVLLMAYMYRGSPTKPGKPALTQPLPAVPASNAHSVAAHVKLTSTPGPKLVAIAPLSLIPLPTRQTNQPEAYCLWPGDTLSQLAINAREAITTILNVNPGYKGLAGSALHLPVGSVPPAQWQQPAPLFQGIQNLPFGLSGYYIGANNRVKRVALTFDIGYIPLNTKRMKMLADHGIQATFFVVGDSMSRHPDVINDILHYGHELGNHSWSHSNMQTMTAWEVVTELQRTEATVKAANSTATTKPYFRAPFGAINETLVRVAREQGYYVVGWTVDSSDWTDGATPDRVYQRVTQNVCPGAIIVMHDVNPANYTALPRIIDYLLGQGYSFVPLSKILAP